MGNSFTFALEPKRMIMEKYLVNPNDSDAFSSEVMHKVVLNGIDFELPEHIWDAIDDAFGNYWNIEVGYGGWPDLNSAVSSISNWLQKKNIIFSIDKIVTIVNVMFDWIEKIPGAILDDNDVVGVVAGASAPKYLIESIVNIINHSNYDIKKNE